jgi:hypothetical protein
MEILEPGSAKNPAQAHLQIYETPERIRGFNSKESAALAESRHNVSSLKRRHLAYRVDGPGQLEAGVTNGMDNPSNLRLSFIPATFRVDRATEAVLSGFFRGLHGLETTLRDPLPERIASVPISEAIPFRTGCCEA